MKSLQKSFCVDLKAALTLLFFFASSYCLLFDCLLYDQFQIRHKDKTPLNPVQNNLLLILSCQKW